MSYPLWMAGGLIQIIGMSKIMRYVIKSFTKNLNQVVSTVFLTTIMLYLFVAVAFSNDSIRDWYQVNGHNVSESPSSLFLRIQNLFVQHKRLLCISFCFRAATHSNLVFASTLTTDGLTVQHSSTTATSTQIQLLSTTSFTVSLSCWFCRR